jgi:hypothetical protein
MLDRKMDGGHRHRIFLSCIVLSTSTFPSPATPRLDGIQAVQLSPLAFPIWSAAACRRFLSFVLCYLLLARPLV